MNNNDLSRSCEKVYTIAPHPQKVCRIDVDKITSLEDVKEILSALNLGIIETLNTVRTNGHDIDRLRKYLK